MTSLQAAEHAHQKAVVAALRAFDALTLQLNVPLRHAGVVADIIASTDAKKIVIEAAAINAAPDATAALNMARRKVAHIKRATGAEHAFVIIPEGLEPEGDDVYTLDALPTAIETILSAPVFRGAIADLGEDTDAPLVYAAMPYKLGFDDVYFLGVVDAALKAGMVVDRIDDVDAKERMQAGVDAAVAFIVDVTGQDEHVISQLGMVQPTEKPLIPICSEKQDSLPEGVSPENTVFYTSPAIDALRQTLTAKLTDIAPSP